MKSPFQIIAGAVNSQRLAQEVIDALEAGGYEIATRDDLWPDIGYVPREALDRAVADILKQGSPLLEIRLVDGFPKENGGPPV